MMLSTGKLFKRVSLFTLSLVLAISGLGVAAPLYFSQIVHATAPILTLTAPAVTTITRSALVPETSGTPTGGNTVVDAAINGLDVILVTLENTGDAASANVRISPINAGAHIQLWAKDTSNNWFDINVTGWIDSAGRSILANSGPITTSVYAISDTTGDYPLTVKLLNASDGTFITSTTGTVTVAPIIHTQADFAAFDGVNIGTNSYTLSSSITATYTGSNTIKLTGYAPIVTPWFNSSWTTYNYVTVGIKLPAGFNGIPITGGTTVYQTGIMRYDVDPAGAYKMSSVGDGSTPLATAGAAAGYLDYSFAANSINTKKDGLVKLQVIWNVGDKPEYFTIDISDLSTLPDTTAPTITDFSVTNPINWGDAYNIYNLPNHKSIISGLPTVGGTINVGANFSDNQTLTNVIAYLPGRGFFADSEFNPIPTNNATWLPVPQGKYSVSWNTHSGYDWRTVTDGNYDFIFEARDKGTVQNGIQNSTTKTISLTIDNTAPSLDFTSPTPSEGSLVKGTITVAANFNDINGLMNTMIGVHAIQWFCNTNWPDNGPYTCTIDTTKLPDGPQKLTIEARDKAGNINQIFRDITVDNIAPSVNFVDPTPGNESYVKGAVTGQVVATDTVGMGSYYIRVWKNAYESGTDNLVRQCSSALGGNLLGTLQDVTCDLDTTTLTPGKYVFSAQFLDSSSNWGTAFRTFYVDNTAPTATIDDIAPKSLYNGSANINVHAIDDNYLKTDLYIEGEANSFKTYTDVYFGLFWLGNGNYRMVVIDKAGNSTEYKFTIDKTAPVIALQGASPQIIERGTSYNELGATVSDNTDSGLDATIDSNVDTSVVGTYTVKYDAVDTAGNHATQVVRTVNVVDTVLPLLTSVSIISNNTHPKFARQTNKVTVNFTADESLTSTPTVTIAGVAATVTGLGTTWSAVHTMSATDAEGYIPFTINFSDLSSNAGLEVATTTNGSTVLYDRTKPTVSITTTETSPTKNSPIHATFTFSEPVMSFASGDIAVTNATKASFVKVDSTTIDGRIYTTTYTTDITPITDGAITINILAGKANDVGNNGNIAATPYTIGYDSIAPTINLVGDNPQTIEAGTAYVELGATWVDDVDGTGSVSNITGTVNTLVPGDYTITYTVTDAAGNNVIATRTVTVEDTTKPIVVLDPITSPNGGSIDLINITGTASDLVGVVGYELSIDGNIVATGKDTVTPYNWNISALSSGTYTVTLTATDAAGNTNSATQDVIIDNTAPTLVVDSSTGTDTTPIVTGTTDRATDIVTVDGNVATVNPIANGNGTYGWLYTLPTQSVGIHTITVISRDIYGNAMSETATVTIDQTPVAATQGQPITTSSTVTPNNDQEVLGASTTKAPASSDVLLSDSNTSVKGASTTKDNTWNIFGLAWYWWVMILAAIGLIAWWIVAGFIRNNNQNA